MTANFVVSAHREIWMPNVRKLFAVDSYIHHVLEREGRLSDYQEIEVAPASRSTREDFIHDHEFVDRKFHQYQDLLAKRLDELHGTNHGNYFWRKAMALGVLRHVTFCYDLFQACERHLNVALHDCRLLDQESFVIPEDFDSHRQIFQHTDLGQEQLFSVYCDLFHPGRFVSWKGVMQPTSQSSELRKPRLRGLFSRLVPNRIARVFSVILDNPARLANEVIGWFLRIRSPQIGIIGCLFSPEHRHRLAVESVGRIQTIPLPKTPIFTSSPQWNMRDLLVREDPGFDRFDKFVLACLRHGMPKMLVENFSKTHAHIKRHFNRYTDLRWVVCEIWIGHSLSSLSMAVLSLGRVKHIYNEHNYLSHFFVGNNLKYLVPLADQFATLGWGDSSIPKLVRGASLFQWIENKRSRIKDIDILLICGLPMARAPEINASYGDSGAYRALEYFDLNARFFASLGDETLRTIYCRGYPSSVVRGWAIWDSTFMLERYIKKLKTYDDSANSAKLLMQRSKLIVSNYLSTAYLEAIIADIPSVFLWNRATNMFLGKYANAFDALIASGICQTSPEEGARFINKIKDDPDKWWRSSVVQKSRQIFLDANIGNPETMIEYLLTKQRN
jgi:putative transferase (TIGR04331 family)